MPRRLSLTAIRWASARSARTAAFRERAPAALADFLLDLIGEGRSHRGRLRHLSELLIERHTRQQRVNALAEIGRRRCIEG